MGRNRIYGCVKIILGTRIAAEIESLEGYFYIFWRVL